MKFSRDTLPNIFGFGQDWNSWGVPEMPDLSVIDRWLGPWQRRVGDLRVDDGRTIALQAWDVAIAVGTSASIWEGSASGTPVNVVKEDAKAVKILDLGGNNKISLFGSKFDTFKIPDPGVLLREGDPAGAHDVTAKVVVVDRNGDPRRLVEMIQINAPGLHLVNTLLANAAGAKFVCGWNTNGSKGRGRYDYDLRKSWQPGDGGTSAGGAPNSPMLLRWDEIERGHISHCLFGVPANYSNEKPIGWARGTDGTWPGHPLRAGDIIRLTQPALDRIVDECGGHSSEAIIARGMRDHGIWIGDKWTRGNPIDGPVKIKQTMDRRWGTGSDSLNPPTGLRLTLADFEVVVQ